MRAFAVLLKGRSSRKINLEAPAGGGGLGVQLLVIGCRAYSVVVRVVVHCGNAWRFSIW